MNPLDQVSSLAILLDASESALPYLRSTLATATTILKAATPGSVTGIYILGSRHSYAPESWNPDFSLPKQVLGGGSFVAPVMELLGQQDLEPQAYVIIGAGTIFDLDDYAVPPERWVLVNTSPGGSAQPMQFKKGRLLEIGPAALDEAALQLNNLPGLHPSHSHPGAAGVIRQHWRLDQAGFPMVQVEPGRFYMHLFPVTHPQFEHFLAGVRRPDYGDAWYTRLLEEAGPRQSGRAPALDDLPGLLMTGVLPEDVQAYLDWHGDDFRPPTVSEWRAAWTWLEHQEIGALPAALEQRMAPLARRIWDRLAAQLAPRSLLDFSLMRNGILEWVPETPGRWALMGKPPTNSFHDPLRDQPLTAPSLTRRSRRYGFRLIRSL